MDSRRNPMVLDRLIDPVSRCLTPEAARQLVALRAAPEVQRRIDELANRSSEGLLSDEERDEYRTCVAFIDFLSLLQAKARQRITEPRPPDDPGD